MATEKRLIDPDDFLKWVIKRFKCVPLVGSCDNDSESMKLLLAQAPTVDAVEVVRCKDCIHYRVFGICPNERRRAVFDGANEFPYPTEPDDYCSYGERRTDG